MRSVLSSSVLRAGLLAGFVALPGALIAQQKTAPPAKTFHADEPITAANATRHFHEPDPIDWTDNEGFTPIFDGKTLKDWDGDPEAWHVEDGAMVGVITKEHPIANTYISYHGAEYHDFDLKVDIKVEQGGGGGIQYRSHVGIPWARQSKMPLPKPAWLLTGPQADFWYPVNPHAFSYTGQVYSENTELGIQAWRGEVAESEVGKGQRLVGEIGNRDELGGYIKINDWNQYEIIARGPVCMHIINGHVMAIHIDDDPKSSNNDSGLIGFELESNPIKISMKNIYIRKYN
ncbi:MAG TPA: DUF1080 domain-containing protein [Granulicella sp.]